MRVVYDAGALVGADRNDRAIWADHRERVKLGIIPIVTSPVIAQVSRSTRQVHLRRFLHGCFVEPFRASDAHSVGALLARANTSDVVDGHVAVVAASADAAVLTSDPNDLRHLSSRLPSPIVVRPV